jgi:prevent-host-death family protein
MKVVPLGEAKNELSTYVDAAQSDRVLITRHGKPAVIMIGVEGEEMEDLMTRANPRFWEMIEERRKNPKTVSADEMRKRFGLEPKAKRARPARATAGRRPR